MKKQLKILKNELDNEYLNKNGFLVIDALTNEQLRKYRLMFNKWHNRSVGSFYKSYFSENMTYKTEIETEIIKDFSILIENKFEKPDLFGGMFVVKPSGEQGHLPPHQDWSFIDEQKHWSLNMWCPLQDVDAKNGNMQMLPGSHDFMKTRRGSNTIDQYFNQKEILEKFIVDIPMKAGQAIFFFHSLIHGSRPNSTLNDRVSLGLSIIQNKAPMYYYYNHDAKVKTEVFNTTKEFYKNYVSERSQTPKNMISAGESNFKFNSIDDDSLIEKIQIGLAGYDSGNSVV